MAACVWTKENRTSLHTLVKATAAKVPWTAGALVYLDDLFGYGLKPEPVREEWWDMYPPSRGFGT